MLLLLRRRSPLLVNLAAYWRLEEATGARAASYGARTLTDNAGVTSAAGIQGNAAAFASASSQFLNHADHADLRMFGTSWTAATWLWLNAIGVAQACMWKGTSAAVTLEYGLRVSAAGVPQFLRSDGAAITTLNWSGAITAAAWHLAIISYDLPNTLMRIRVDNGTTVTGAGVELNGTGAFSLSRQGSSATQYWDGRLDETALWKRLLTSAEESWLWNGGAGRSWSDVLAYRGS